MKVYSAIMLETQEILEKECFSMRNLFNIARLWASYDEEIQTVEFKADRKYIGTYYPKTHTWKI